MFVQPESTSLGLPARDAGRRAVSAITADSARATQEPAGETSSIDTVRERQIVEHMQTAAVVCDERLHVVYLNASAQQMLNVSAPRIIGEPLPRLFPGDPEFLVMLERALHQEQPITLREVSLRSSFLEEPITVDCTATPLLGHGEAPTELLVELAAIDRLMRLARESAWLDAHAANQAVIRGVAHEVKNPLGGLRGAAQLLERQFEDPDLHEYTRIIINEADRLRALVDRMAGPARPFTPNETNIHSVLEHVRALMLADSPPGVTIECDYDPSLPTVAAEEQLLIQATLNLVKNAIEAVGESGQVLLRTRIDRQITIGQVRHRQVLRVDVIDSGPGVPEAIQDTLFYPLVTGRADGTGLGLSITQDIVSRHSGLMAFTSVPGETTFTLFIPVERL